MNHFLTSASVTCSARNSDLYRTSITYSSAPNRRQIQPKDSKNKRPRHLHVRNTTVGWGPQIHGRQHSTVIPLCRKFNATTEGIFSATMARSDPFEVVPKKSAPNKTINSIEIILATKFSSSIQ